MYLLIFCSILAFILIFIQKRVYYITKNVASIGKRDIIGCRDNHTLYNEENGVV